VRHIDTDLTATTEPRAPRGRFAWVARVAPALLPSPSRHSDEETNDMRRRTSLDRRSRRARSRGLSTAEVLAGAALTILTVGAIFTVQQAQLKAFAAQQTYAQSQSVTRTVIDMMSREGRMAGYNPTYQSALLPGALTVTNALSGCPNQTQAIIEATPTRFRFRQDLNGDGLIALPGEDVTYQLQNGQIVRTDTVGGAAVALVDNVPASGLTFRYFDGSNPPVELVPGGAPPSLTVCQRVAVAKVRVNIEADIPNPNPKITTPVKSIAESEIALRNRTATLSNF
jgi:hypothetical protein